MLAKEVERNPERNPNQCEYTLKRKKTNNSKNKELLKKVICFRCGQTGHIAKDRNCPKNNKDKKRTTVQIYAAREEEETEESEPYGGSQYTVSRKSNAQLRS